MLGIAIRLYQIYPALLESVSNRQIIDAYIVRGLYERGFGELKLHLFGLPLYHLIVAGLYKLVGLEIEEVGRLLSVAFSLGAAVFFYKLMQLYGSKRQALLGLIYFYLLSPVHIIMSRSFLVDELTLFSGIVSLYFLAKNSLRPRQMWFWLGTLMMAITLLSKFTFGYLLLPALWWVNPRRGSSGRWSMMGVFAAMVMIPVIAWSLYTKAANEALIGGQPTGEWNILYVFSPQNLIDPGYWINVSYFLARYAVTFAWLPLVFLGLVWGYRDKKLTPFYLWLVGALGFILAFSVPSRTHNYYFLAFVPAAAFFAALASDRLKLGGKNTVVTAGLLIIGLASLVSDDFLKAYRTYPPYQRIPQVGRVVRDLTEAQDIIVTSAYRTEAILYFAHREGWELRLGPLTDEAAIRQLEEWKEGGAKYYVVYDQEELVSKPLLREYLKTYPTVWAEGPTIIYRL